MRSNDGGVELTGRVLPAREESENIIRMLVERYPGCFFQPPQRRRPLKKGVLKDLLDDGFPVANEALTSAIHWYESHFGYQYAMQAGAKRIDLDGKDAGTVTEQEARAAQNYIQERRQDQQERNLRSPISVMRSLHQAGKIPDDALGKIAAPRQEGKKMMKPKTDPLSNLEGALESVRRVMAENSEPLRSAFAVAGLRVLIAEAQRVLTQIEPASTTQPAMLDDGSL